MKLKQAIRLLFVLVVVVGFSRLLVKAQGTQQTSFSANPGPLSGCPTPAPLLDHMCDVTGQGWMESIQGAAYTPVGAPAAAPAPVQSVFGRTGVIVAKTGDYNFTSISGTVAQSQLPPPVIPAAFSCTGATVSNSATGSGLSVSGCK